MSSLSSKDKLIIVTIFVLDAVDIISDTTLYNNLHDKKSRDVVLLFWILHGHKINRVHLVGDDVWFDFGTK